MNDSFVVPFTSSDNAAVAQVAMALINTAVQSGFLGSTNWAGGSGVVSSPAAPNILGNAVVSVPGVSNLGVLPASYYALTNLSTGIVAAIGGPNTTVVSGNQSTLIYMNTATDGEIFLGGGRNYIAQAYPSSGAFITVDGGPSGTLGSGSAIIDASIGSTTVALYPNALANIVGGGHIEVLAKPGNVVVGISGNSTVPAHITGSAGGNIIYTPDGGRAVINPGAGNLIVVEGTGGSETVFGGGAPFAGLADAADFTGSATVFAGIGYFQGGAAGGNVLLTSTVPGATTLVGGGGNDLLQANAAGNVLRAGAGSATLFASAQATGGVTFITGGGAATVFGAASGNNVIEFGAGSATVYGQHNVGGAGGLTGNTYFDIAAGGHQTIGDFLSGFDRFDLSRSAGAPSVASLSFFASGADSPFGQVGSRAVLSDGTTIDFVNAHVAQSGTVLT